MYEVDRMVAVIKPTQIFVDWVNTHIAEGEEPVTLEDLLIDCTAILIPPFDEASDAVEYIEALYTEIFETELETWFLDEAFWPEKRTFQLFNEWFNVEFHSLVFDLAGVDDLEDTERSGNAGSTTLQ